MPPPDLPPLSAAQAKVVRSLAPDLNVPRYADGMSDGAGGLGRMCAGCFEVCWVFEGAFSAVHSMLRSVNSPDVTVSVCWGVAEEAAHTLRSAFARVERPGRVEEHSRWHPCRQVDEEALRTATEEEALGGRTPSPAPREVGPARRRGAPPSQTKDARMRRSTSAGSRPLPGTLCFSGGMPRKNIWLYHGAQK